ncbi:amidohydrolase family protein [Roseisalinus antarcticus]|uniref:8-oxoguanine deaminase n=1 Tax=Roseisalinus antarcticus TaxID=254357 RepID=A0A1Y5RKX5_9RHOB|nr:amidohydrolase family protein [Roseisalinus antarcticus]SLN19905.1 8-oxoguanine deaminase [Roseisalinus antarcticus]
MTKTCITGGQNVSLAQGEPDAATGDILIDAAGRIEAIGPGLAGQAEQVIDAAGMIVMPGFVNAHIHTWQTGLRGIAANWTLGQYLKAMHAGLATHFRPEDVGIANQVGLLHQLHAGATTIADWCHNNPTPDHTDAAIEGLKAAGGRAVFLHGSPKADPKPGQPHFSEVPMPRDEVLRLRSGPLSDPDGLVTLGLAVLGPQLSVEAVSVADLSLARELGLPASMHISAPNMMWPEGLAALDAMGLLGPWVNITHANCLSDEDLGRVVAAGVSISVTPEVELQMGFGEPLTNRVRALGGNAQLSLGTDIESGMAGEMFSVARFALQAARHELTLASRRETGMPPAETGLSAREALEWATIGGARMLGLDDRIGTLEPGKLADIILVDAKGINMRPVHDPIASVLFHAGPRDVDTVLVGGRIVKRGGALVGASIEPLIDRLEASGRRIMQDFTAATA